MLVTTQLERVFMYKDGSRDLPLSDPNSALSPEAVRNFYSGTYGPLTTARVEGPEVEKDKAVYRFVPTIGTKG
jgi:PRTRC genetic system protein C